MREDACDVKTSWQVQNSEIKSYVKMVYMYGKSRNQVKNESHTIMQYLKPSRTCQHKIRDIEIIVLLLRGQRINRKQPVGVS